MVNQYTQETSHTKTGFNWLNTRVVTFLKKRWVYHIIFWLLYYFVFSLIVVYALYQIRSVLFYLELVPIYLLDIALAYFNFYVLMPKLLAHRKYLLYGLALFVAISIVACINVFMKHVYAQHGSALYAITADFTFSNMMSAVIERFYAVILTSVIKIAKDGLQNQQRIKEKENQLLEAELNFLKSQIQPHFFFNTLNNLYSLTLKKSDEAPEVVLKLSDLMSYMLYETNTSKVSLNKEISYLQNYIDLERLRFGKNLHLQLTIEGDTDGIYLPPLVLILFIENSFKHGARNVANALEIDIALKVEDGFLLFNVTNPFAETVSVKSKTGIGLKNARRRLELLYGSSYNLNVLKTANLFTVSLKIPV